nr:MAG TPA: hypothetical protein [Caudoviricetes sp.]
MERQIYAMALTAPGMTAEMNAVLLLPYPASNKKIPGFLLLELAGFLPVGRFKAVFMLRREIILKTYKIVCIGLVAKNRDIYD